MLLTALSLTAASGGYREGEKAQRSKSQMMVIYECIGNFYKCFRLKKFSLAILGTAGEVVVGSSPTGGAKKKDTLKSVSFFLTK